tara:strand:+ start:6526 stop:8112 length:1587 start_codon:yes stop_codon:yes gene_type:complete
LRILSYHFGHDGSITYLDKGRIVYHTQLERLNKFKSNAIPSRELIINLKKNNIQADIFILTWVIENNWCDKIIELFKRNNIITNQTQIVKIGRKQHHIFHALCAFHFTKFTEANIYVFDGHGAAFYNKDDILLEEAVSGYIFKEKKIEAFKIYYGSKDSDTYDGNIPECGVAYAKLNTSLGLEYSDCGKSMAFSTYGKENSDIKSFLNEEYIFNTKYFNGQDGYIPIQNLKQQLTLNKNDDYSKDIAWRVQKDFEEKALYDIKKFIKQFPCKNLIITGGCAQNIFTNTRLFKELDVNVSVDPLCNDQGISLGAAIKCGLEVSYKTINRFDDVFLGFLPEYNLEIFKDYQIKKVDDNFIVDLLLNKEVIALFSGQSEQGQRGLGHRSLLIDANLDDAKERMSKIKKRAWYRPFACSILEEDFLNYFESENITKSPYMLYVFKMKKPIKSIVSKDGYSRVQTVDIENTKYFNLLQAFKKRTNIPYLLNTSLNLPGEALVETLEDLKFTFENSDLKYAYLPDINKLIIKQN